MGRNALFIAGLVIFDGAAVAWAAWEFWKIRPGKTDKPAEINKAEINKAEINKAEINKIERPGAFSRVPIPSGLPDPPGHPEREHGPDHG